MTILLQLVLPLSMPIVAVMILYYGVSHWNSYFSALIYLRDRMRYPLQLIMRSYFSGNDFAEQGGGEHIFGDDDQAAFGPRGAGRRGGGHHGHQSRHRG